VATVGCSVTNRELIPRLEVRRHRCLCNVAHHDAGRMRFKDRYVIGKLRRQSVIICHGSGQSMPDVDATQWHDARMDADRSHRQRGGQRVHRDHCPAR